MARTSSLRLLSSPPSAPHPLPVCAARLGPARRRFHVSYQGLGESIGTIQIVPWRGSAVQSRYQGLGGINHVRDPSSTNSVRAWYVQNSTSLRNSYGARNTASGVNMIAARSAMVVLAVS